MLLMVSLWVCAECVRRPSLMKYIENLSAPAVKKASEKALTGLKNGGPLKSAIEALCELKGVRSSCHCEFHACGVITNALTFTCSGNRSVPRQHPLFSLHTTTM